MVKVDFIIVRELPVPRSFAHSGTHPARARTRESRFILSFMNAISRAQIFLSIQSEIAIHL